MTGSGFSNVVRVQNLLRKTVGKPKNESEYQRRIEPGQTKLEKILGKIRGIHSHGPILAFSNKKTLASLGTKFDQKLEEIDEEIEKDPTLKGKSYAPSDRIRATVILGANVEKLKLLAKDCKNIIDGEAYSFPSNEHYDGPVQEEKQREPWIMAGQNKNSFSTSSNPNKGYSDIKLFFALNEEKRMTWREAAKSVRTRVGRREYFEIILITYSEFIAKSGKDKFLKLINKNAYIKDKFEKSDRSISSIMVKMADAGAGHKLYKIKPSSPELKEWHKKFENAWYMSFRSKSSLNRRVVELIREYDKVFEGATDEDVNYTESRERKEIMDELRALC